MRVEYWNPNQYDQTFENITVDRLVKAAKVVRASTKKRLSSELGKGKTTGINRPVYMTGDKAGEPYTAREFGQMMSSIRLVQKRTKVRKALSKKKNIRIYAGHYLAFYANIFEFYRPFMRPAFEQSVPMIKTLIGAK